jgi:antitoxin MazE
MYNYLMRIKLTKWGNSLGIRLPKVFAIQMGIENGGEVDIEVQNNSIIISHARSLDALLDQITPDMLHGEVDTGASIGKEIW